MSGGALPAILLGAGGHARVVRALAEALGIRILGVCDPVLPRGSDWAGLPVLGDDDALAGQDPAGVVLLNGIGKLPGRTLRHRLQHSLAARGFGFPTLVHPAAWVAPDAQLGQGVQVMAGAVVQPGGILGAGSIVNTRAGVDHDARIGPDVHIAPGATLCGDVEVGEGAFVGAGAVVLPGRRIGAGATVAAGATLARDLPAGGLHRRPAQTEGAGP
jgi:UDP-perosamine 4-acetyltransferase